MYVRSRRGLLTIPALLLALAFPLTVLPQNPHSRALVTQSVNDSVLYRLAGNTRPEATAENDAGPVENDFAMDHMLLQLARPAEQETALNQLIESQHDPASPNYHLWLTPADLGTNFGPAPEDIQAVTTWLESNGFTVNTVYPNGMLIDFSGDAGQVKNAFHTEIHRLNVNGVAHIANMSDPMIPEALAPVVAGVVSMHDFMPHSLAKTRANYTFTSSGETLYAVTPGDLATIYNFTPVYNQKITGQGQTIAVIEDSDMYSTADWTTFRSTFGLTASYPSGSLTTVHPKPASGANNCTDPGVNSDDVETELDAEWASAAAPNAAIQVVTCADSGSTFGGLIAINNMLSTKSIPSIISISYGECEAENGAAANASYSSAFQSAASMGVSVFVAAGDEGAASCDGGATGATHGIGISGFASTQYNLAVGGTDFYDTALGTNSSYWNSSNSSTYVSAKSYIPEIPWNASCAGSILVKYLDYPAAYGTNGLCDSSTASQDGLQEVVAGSGGPSGCATGSPGASTPGVVSGTCAGWKKPTWQSNSTGDNVRDIPDVSLFASNGLWGHYYVVCYSDRRNGGAPCTGAPGNWTGAGGTSFASPIMAGIQALINQKMGSSAGNPAPEYYALYGVGGVFNSVTAGDNVVNCSGSVNCYGATTTTTSSGGGHGGHAGHAGGGGNPPDGELSTSTSLSPAYAAGAGWNFATGLGSVNVDNLVNNWK